MDKKKLLKVIIPICLVVIVAGIWIFKDVNKGSDSIVAIPENKGSENLVTPKNQEDSVLEAASIGLVVLKEYNLPIVIDFGADSCIPCKEMAPILKTLNAEMQGKAIIKFVDVLSTPALFVGRIRPRLSTAGQRQGQRLVVIQRCWPWFLRV